VYKRQAVNALGSLLCRKSQILEKILSRHGFQRKNHAKLVPLRAAMACSRNTYGFLR